MKAAELAGRLSEVTRLRRHGRAEWTAECPNCRRLTLHFRDGKNGLLIVCQAAVSDVGRHGFMVDGCDAQHIAAALRLTEVDLLGWRDVDENALQRMRESAEKRKRRVRFMNLSGTSPDGSDATT
jgi:hypothetical protein